MTQLHLTENYLRWKGLLAQLYNCDHRQFNRLLLAQDMVEDLSVKSVTLADCQLTNNDKLKKRMIELGLWKSKSGVAVY